jgi:HEAT repeat protein
MKLLPFGAAALLAALLGCGGNKPAKTELAPSASDPASADQETGAKETGLKEPPATTTESAATKEASPKVVQSPSEPPRQAGDELRTLVAELVEKSPEGFWRMNDSVALELEKLEDSGQVELDSLLGDARPDVRRGAAFYLLARFDAANARQVAGYTALLRDQEPYLRSLGFQAVRKMRKTDQAAAVPRLTELLAARHEPSVENRAALARLLGSLKQDAAPALDALTAGATDDESPKVRGAYLMAISQIASPEQALAAFRQGLADPEAPVRLVASARLRQMEKAAAPAAEELAQALEDADPSVREVSAEALVRIGPASVEPLIKRVDSKEAHTRQLAIACLGRLGPAAKPALSRVEKHLTDDDPEVKQVAEAVVKILKGS